MAEAVSEGLREGAAAPVTTTDLWKLAGLAFVLVDHYGLFFDEDQAWWRVVGRLAAPVFFFFIGFARTRRVPWSWPVLGLVLTAVGTFTSGEGLGKIELNILINFAYVRLLLPMVERHVMSHPARVALLAVAIVALIRPVAQVLEYGAEGWLWALFGLSHRLALEQGTARAVLTRNLLAGLAAGVYAVTEVADHGLGAAPALVLVGLLAALAAALVRFRRAELTGQPPRPLAALARFCGRRSLEIYAISLLVMQISAYAVETSEDDEDE